MGLLGRVHQATPLEHIADSVLPIVEAGQAVFVANDYALNDEVWLEPTPGHTPNHVSVHLASNGSHAVITGDMMHSPVQCAELMWVARPILIETWRAPPGGLSGNATARPTY